MRVTLVHHHLRPGGVTRIIAHAAASLEGQGVEVCVLTGEPPPADWRPATRVVPGLAYEEQRPRQDPAQLAVSLQQAAGPTDLWHVHNHSLGKNLALPGALQRLYRDGARLLLQIHDFAEDGRPALYRRMRENLGGEAALGRLLYPQAGQVHYALLNSRDRSALVEAGVPLERVHGLPNPVALEPPREKNEGCEGRLWLYPTRAIRRKNLGEFLLCAALAPEGDRFATTLAPENPAEQPRYRDWVALAGGLKLPLEFALGTHPGVRFEDLLSSAHALVTTSIAEGFGMAFLEPWLAARTVSGRDLPEITGEFEAAGMGFPDLYRRLSVPLDWLGPQSLRERARQGLEAWYRHYATPVPDDALERTWAAWVQAGGVDFGRLDEPLQERVVRRVKADPGGSGLRFPLSDRGCEAGIIAANRQVIEERYGLEAYGERLRGIYQELLAAPLEAQTDLPPGAVLMRFLAPERLYLLRSE